MKRDAKRIWNGRIGDVFESSFQGTHDARESSDFRSPEKKYDSGSRAKKCDLRASVVGRSGSRPGPPLPCLKRLLDALVMTRDIRHERRITAVVDLARPRHVLRRTSVPPAAAP